METNNQQAVQPMLLNVSSSPHVRSNSSTKKIMLDVIIALVPAIIASVVFFGMKALMAIIISVAGAVAAEALTQKLLKRPVTVYDLSAVVTGILLAFNVPAGFPFWKLIVADIFAIVVVKQFFGGIGSNFMNPALAGRAFLLAAWPQDMSVFMTPSQPDVVSGPTPLSGGTVPPMMDMFLGKMPGMLGEVSAIALLIGCAYLVVRGIISIRIPGIYILSFAVFEMIFGQISGTAGFADLLPQILSGGLILGAVFMATDYASSPMTKDGQIIYALGCGFLTAMIRCFGGYPEGVSYAILLMNCCTPLLDKKMVRKPFGFGGEKK